MCNMSEMQYIWELIEPFNENCAAIPTDLTRCSGRSPVALDMYKISFFKKVKLRCHRPEVAFFANAMTVWYGHHHQSTKLNLKGVVLAF